MALPQLAAFSETQPKTKSSPWHAVELDTSAVRAVWQRRGGEQFEIFREAVLRLGKNHAKCYPCQKCGLNLAVTGEGPDNIIALCQDCPHNCQGIHLTADDVELLELDWQKLARKLCRAFSLDPKAADLHLRNTCQIGSWSAESVPVFLTIQREDYDFEYVVNALVARYRRQFILLAPTNRHLGANSC